jgi:RNA polymerase sigma factor (sigma-70 family)
MTGMQELITEPEQGDFPLRIEIRLKHGVLDDLAKSIGGRDVLAKELGVTATTVSHWINLRTIPTFGAGKGKGGMSRDRARRVALKLCELTGKRIEDIFPSYSREVFRDCPKKIEVDRPLSARQAAEALARKESQRRLAGPDPTECAEQTELKEAIGRAIETLPTRAAMILKMRFGIPDGISHDLGEVGSAFGITRERVRQIETKAIRALRQPSRVGALVGHDESEG